MSLVIRAQDVAKHYRLGVVNRKMLYEELNAWWARVRGKEDPTVPVTAAQSRTAPGGIFWALKGVSFDVNEGEVVGIIGENGAGKSTLLKILSQITSPSRGRLALKGRVASLLEVGTGFHPELTGRENVFLNGAILGMTRKEVAQKFDEIVDFSGVERFIDTPVKRYSSGMTVRLAFAVAAHLDPEILIVDEVLAVGDEAFQEKCLGKMEDVTKQGRTLLFVSHNMASVNNLCKRTIVMEEGSVAFDGPTSEAVAHYLRHIAHADEDSKQNPVEFAHDPKLPFQIRSVGIFGPGGQPMLRLPYHDDFELRLTVEVVEPNHNYYTGFSLHDGVGNCIAVCTDEDTQVAPVAKLGPGLHCYRVPISGRWLKPGSYTVTVFGECWFAPLHHRHEGILEFHIVDLASRRASKNMYRKQAVVAPEIEWTIASDECPT